MHKLPPAYLAYTSLASGALVILLFPTLMVVAFDDPESLSRPMEWLYSLAILAVMLLPIVTVVAGHWAVRGMHGDAKARGYYAAQFGRLLGGLLAILMVVPAAVLLPVLAAVAGRRAWRRAHPGS